MAVYVSMTTRLSSRWSPGKYANAAALRCPDSTSTMSDMAKRAPVEHSLAPTRRHYGLRVRPKSLARAAGKPTSGASGVRDVAPQRVVSS
jgi:hypothetical protein